MGLGIVFTRKVTGGSSRCSWGRVSGDQPHEYPGFMGSWALISCSDRKKLCGVTILLFLAHTGYRDLDLWND